MLSLFCCCKKSVVDEEEEERFIPVTVDVVNTPAINERLVDIVRSKKGKMVNIGSNVPFALHDPHSDDPLHARLIVPSL